MASAIQNTNNWQIAMRTLSDSATFLFNNKTMSDVTFVFKNRNSECESTEEIHAHSWILSMLSPVFYNSFKNNFEVSKQIPVSDSSYEIFLECLRFVYKSECILTTENAYEVMKVAQKYSLNFLESDCADYLMKSITVDTVCQTLDNALTNGENSLQEKLIEFIAPQIAPILQTNSFINIKKGSLEAILNIEKTGPITEVEIFDGVMKWAAEKCISTQMVVNGSNKRLQLGELLKTIRFPTMTSSELAQCFEKEQGLFTNEEEHSLLISTLLNKNNKLGFRSDAREYLIDLDKITENQIYLFITGRSVRNYIGDSNIRSKFTVNKMIYLTGVKTAEPTKTQNATIQFIKERNIIWFEEKFHIVYKSYNIIYFTKPLLLKPNQEYIVDVQFDNKNSQFEHYDKIPTPWSDTVNGFEFNFSELSQLMLCFFFKSIE